MENQFSYSKLTDQLSLTPMNQYDWLINSFRPTGQHWLTFKVVYNKTLTINYRWNVLIDRKQVPTDPLESQYCKAMTPRKLFESQASMYGRRN